MVTAPKSPRRSRRDDVSEHTHEHSVYLRCSACLMFGVTRPGDDTCGNCGNAFQNVRYLPPCCVEALRADLARAEARVAELERELDCAWR